MEEQQYTSECEKCKRTTHEYYEDNIAICMNCHVCTRCHQRKTSSDFMVGFIKDSPKNECKDCMYELALIVCPDYERKRFDYMEAFVARIAKNSTREDIKVLIEVILARPIIELAKPEGFDDIPGMGTLTLHTKPTPESLPTATDLESKYISQTKAILSQLNSIYEQLLSLVKQFETSPTLDAVCVQIQCIYMQLDGLITQTKALPVSVQYIHIQVQTAFIQFQSVQMQIKSPNFSTNAIYIQLQSIANQLKNIFGDGSSDDLKTLPEDKALSGGNNVLGAPKFIYENKECVICKKLFSSNVEWKITCENCYTQIRAKVDLPVEQLRRMFINELGEMQLAWGKKYLTTRMCEVPDSYFRWMSQTSISHLDIKANPHIYYYGFHKIVGLWGP